MELAASQLVKLYMQTQITMGYILYPPTPEARLLDALNGLPNMELVKRGKFIELFNVTIEHAYGRQEKLPVAYVNKATVQLAATFEDGNMGRGIGAQLGHKSYPFIEKSPIPVCIEMQSYVVNGNMHHMATQKIWNVLEDTLIFLPLTHVQICTVANGVQERFPFVAINKEHILSLLEENDSSVLRRKAVELKNRSDSKKP
jgi:hypothetical protein